MDGLEAAVEALPVGVVVAGRDGRTTRVNRRARELLGIDAGAAAPDWLATLLAGVVACGESLRETVHVPGAEGAPVSVQIDAAPVDAAGLVVCTVEDLTERARRERADREFITNAAHQLRTPIAAIATAVEVLQGGAKDLPEARDRFLGHIELQTERLVRLARAMLVLARVERGDATPALGPVLLQPLLVALVDEAPAGHRAAVLLECPSDLAAHADAPLLAEALANILSNALEHTPSGEVRITASEEGGRVSIEVVDTGSGIVADELPHVFERFRRGIAAGGVGLGLPIAKAAAAAAGGTIEIESQEGVGTTVRVELPRAHLDTAAEPAPAT